MILRTPFLMVLLLAVSPSLGTAAQSDRCSALGPSAAEIPFTSIGDHIYTDATVNATGPYRFIVDTGGVNLIDDSLVKPLSLKITGTEAGQGTGPNTIESGKTTLNRLTVGNITFTDQPFYTFDFGQLYAGGGVKMMGMIGANVFRGYVTCIDFEHGAIDLVKPIDFNPSHAGSGLPMTIKGSDITVKGSFDGIAGTFQIDTGSPGTVMLSAPFVARHHLLKRFPRQIQSSSGGVGGATQEITVRGKDLVLGAERIAHPITAMAAVPTGNLATTKRSGIIGIGALKRYVVTFDFPRKRLYLKPYAPAPAYLDSYDRSGMRVEVAPTGFRVKFVAEGTPAAKAGLRPGDTIVAVDGRAASRILLPTFRDELTHRPAGSVIVLEIETQGEKRTVNLILRDLLDDVKDRKSEPNVGGMRGGSEWFGDEKRQS